MTGGTSGRNATQSLWDARDAVSKLAAEVTGRDASRDAMRQTVTDDHVTVEHVASGVLVRLPAY